MQKLLEELKDRLLKMKKDNSFRAMDALIRNLSQHQKSILADAENLKKLYMNWTSATAKVGLLFKCHVSEPRWATSILIQIFVLNRSTDYTHLIMYNTPESLLPQI